MQDDLNNPFWQFCLELYAKQGVEPLLLSLQDSYGLNINLLLLMAFLNQQKRHLTRAELEQLCACSPKLVAKIKAQRETRRCLKGGGDDKAYRQAKEEELALEQLHIAKLYQGLCSFKASLEETASDDNIRAYIKNAMADVLPQALEQQIRELRQLIRN